MSRHVPKVAPGVRCPSCGGPATYAPRENARRYRCLRCHEAFGDRSPRQLATAAVGVSGWARDTHWRDGDER